MSITIKKEIARLGFIGFVSLLASVSFTFPSFAVSVSDLLISEIMANPAATADSRGEWFELYNPTVESINLNGFDLGDDGSNRHRFDTDLLIMPGQFLTLARSADPGFVPDYVYDNFTLANSADEIVFRDGSLELLRLDYDSGFAQAGISRELQQLPMLASNYGLTLASLTYGSGDIGTPGEAGGMFLAPSAVPIPAGAWLFFTGVLAIFSPTALRKIVTSSVIPIRRTATQAGRSDVSVSKRPEISIAAPRILLAQKTWGLQS